MLHTGFVCACALTSAARHCYNAHVPSLNTTRDSPSHSPHAKGQPNEKNKGNVYVEESGPKSPTKSEVRWERTFTLNEINETSITHRNGK
eukprot:m.19579 g.19579  ORF g.19579 m.19579 type:complete len:90 (-) comp8053_c0_seq1:2147-2416(-)